MIQPQTAITRKGTGVMYMKTRNTYETNVTLACHHFSKSSASEMEPLPPRELHILV